MPGRLLSLLGRRAPLFLAGGVFLGLVMPESATAVRPALGPLVALLLTVSLLRMDWAVLAGYLRRPGAAALATAWHLGVSPVLVWGATLVAGLPPGLAQSLILNGAAPSLAASTTLAQLIRLDAPFAAIQVVATTCLLPLALTPVMFWLMGIELAIDLGAFFARFGLFIGLPFVAAWGLRRVLPAALVARSSDHLDGVGVVLLVLAALAMMDGVTARLLAEPATVAAFLAAAVAFNAAFQALGVLLFWAGGRRRAFSAGLTLGNRNMGMMLVLVADIMGPDLALYVAMAQIPVYLMPLVAKPLYGRLMAAERAGPV